MNFYLECHSRSNASSNIYKNTMGLNIIFPTQKTMQYSLTDVLDGLWCENYEIPIGYQLYSLMYIDYENYRNTHVIKMRDIMVPQT